MKTFDSACSRRNLFGPRSLAIKDAWKDPRSAEACLNIQISLPAITNRVSLTIIITGVRDCAGILEAGAGPDSQGY